MKNENGYVDSFARLIKCPTVTDSGHEYFEAFHKVLDEEFPHAASVCEKIKLGRDVLLYKWTGKSSERPLVLMAHQDVVPATGTDWTHDPFGAEIQDGKMYGRGTIDCKNTLFCTIQAVDELIAEGFVPEQDVYLSYSDCEETGGPGAEMARDYFIEHGVKPFTVVDEGGAIICADGETFQKDAAMIGILEKGYADVKFIARGKGGHSSQPPKHTPIARLGALVNYCEKHSIFKAQMSPAAKAMIKGLGDVVVPKYARVCKTVDWTGWLMSKIAPKVSPALGGGLFSTTMVFTMMKGASASNIIPQEAWVNANLRFAPTDKPEDCFKKLEKIAKKFDVDTEISHSREASPLIDFEGDGYKTFAQAVKDTYPEVGVVPYLMFGGTDCRTMQTIAVNAIRCTPCKMTNDQLGTMHAANENITLSALDKCVEFFKKFIKSSK